MNILVVDDSKSIRDLVAECVRSMGHVVFFAENGQAGLSFVEKNAIDLVLMDIEMPVMNGLEATKAIRKLKQDDWFPIIFLTTRVDDTTFTDGILAGGDAYLTKPINPLRLQLTVVAMERIYEMRQKLYKTQKELQHLSLFDELTGLANRRNYDQTLETQFKLAQRNKAPLSLIICDIDFFKHYNDEYGHQQGDKCLADVAQMIGSMANRPTDLACRYGGEEFTVILPDTNLEGALKIAEKIRLAVYESGIEHKASRVADVITLSLGVSTYFGQLKSSEQLTNLADKALYQAKQKGRNTVEIM